MSTLKNYIKIYKEHFSLLRIGDYIRWEKIYDEGISSGGAIMLIGKTKAGKKNWRIKKGTFEFQLYWDSIDYLWLKKHPFYNMLEEKISILSGSIAFLVKELDLGEEFLEFDKKIKKTLQNKRNNQIS